MAQHIKWTVTAQQAVDRRKKLTIYTVSLSHDSILCHSSTYLDGWRQITALLNALMTDVNTRGDAREILGLKGTLRIKFLQHG